MAFLLLLAGCDKPQVGREEALVVAKDFVNNNVKFYSADDGKDDNISTVDKARISVTGMYKIGDEWHFTLEIFGNTTEGEKSSGLIVVVDANNGEVKREQLQAFEIMEDDGPNAE